MTRLLLFIALASTLAIPQGITPATKACSSPEASQFDFWVGDWDLTWDSQAGGSAGKGTNTIRRIMDGCVIQEQFQDAAQPFRGMSVSTWTPQLKKWQQTWVDNAGSYLDFTGEFQKGEMILSRQAVAKDGKRFHQRMVWKNIKADSFDWSWERSDDGGKTWKVMWPIHYQRRKS